MIARFTSKLKILLEQQEQQLVNVFFWIFLISFIIDRVIFYFFINFPFFVASSIIVLPFLIIATQYRNPSTPLYILIFTFIITAIINSIIFIFGLKNISDLLFIILFIAIYFYYKKNIYFLSISNTYILLIATVLLFSFTFLGINSDRGGKAKYDSYFSISNKTNPDKITQLSNPKKRDGVKKVDTAEFDIVTNIDPEKITPKESFGITKADTTKVGIINNINPEKSNKRTLHAGLFRRTHIASYLFGFLFLFFAYRYHSSKKTANLLLAILVLFFCFYTGIRSIPIAFIISILIFLFRKDYALYFILLSTIVIGLIINIDFFLTLTDNTFFYQFFDKIYSLTENINELARFKLYQSWWREVSSFRLVDFLIGKSFMNASIANSKNINMGLWFHNDFLNIFFTYGTICTLLYIWFFIKIYVDNMYYIRKNIFISMFYWTMVIAAIINGFYYYFPVFILYLFLIMIKQEELHNKSSEHLTPLKP